MYFTMSKNNSNSSSGISFLGLMFLIFMTLKLTGYITWSWWWVTAPLWGGIAIAGVFAIIVLIIVLIKKLN